MIRTGLYLSRAEYELLMRELAMGAQAEDDMDAAGDNPSWRIKPLRDLIAAEIAAGGRIIICPDVLGPEPKPIIGTKKGRCRAKNPARGKSA